MHVNPICWVYSTDPLICAHISIILEPILSGTTTSYTSHAGCVHLLKIMTLLYNPVHMRISIHLWSHWMNESTSRGGFESG